MAAPKEIVELVERFESNREAYKSGHYNETQVRREFVDPLFKALGWDIDNEQGFAEAYKDVIHEDAIKVGGTTRAPDYSFRIGGQRKFFLETKKPSVDIKEDIHPAFQLRRYAWTAKLPLSILTDFEEFSVYDCTIKPDKKDMPSKGRILYLTCRDYLEQWDEIAAIFSKNAILKGSFDKYARDKRGKRGTAQVDSAFLEEIAGWREILARNIALRNPELDTRDLNYAVQATVNRIVFLRICEDRGIERLMKMEDLLSGERVYPRLCELFRRADERYNSGIFHFEKESGRENPDTLSLRLNIDDKPLKDIIRRLYYPDSPYEFSVLPAEILGQVYEQFLGKVIRLTDGHRAVVEDKPEVKKAGGVKYTPAYIVDYIVKNTLGPTLEGKTPSDATKISVLDPACGSGSFLIVAYQHLLDWHREWYVQNLLPMLQSGLRPSSIQIRHMLPGIEGASKGRKKEREPELPVFQGRGGEWRLTTAERKRILLNNIYGVDIDRQAVEVTKLSLLLKVLEGENEETISKQLTLFSERALPDLSRNIKCGNSLIGWDILEENPSLGQEEIERINPFDWRAEYPEVFGRGGFDVVIGNPPYVRQEGLGEFKGYFQKHFQVYQGTADLYAYFMERGVSLLQDEGIFSYIVANKWMRANYGLPLRRWLKEQCIEEITDFGDLPVFLGATTYPCIIRIVRRPPQSSFQATQVKTLNFNDLGEYVNENGYKVNQLTLDDSGWSLADEATQALLDKLKGKGVPLGEYVGGKIYYGIKTGLNEAFVIDAQTREKLIAEDPKSEELIKPFLAGRDIKRYQQPVNDKYLILIPRGWTREKSSNAKDALGWLKGNYPAMANHLLPFAQAAGKRYDKGEYWWELRACDYYNEFEKQKIVYAEIASKGQFTLDNGYKYYDTTAYIISCDDDLMYLIGLLNSKLWTFLFSKQSSEIRGGFFRWKRQYLSPLPIRTIDFSEPADVARHDSLVSLGDRMLALHKQLQETRTPHDEIALKRQIEATDRQIDALVYELYGLTEDEIGIVEGSTK
ncbi:Eco57I restriction-modification methylase domain-containing protein [Methanothrix soehngenii]|uniref:Eco57I restriction-modification methylase domain-containing protein n=1 Tax=Methanothrix soehngenii TaxID=2223 RepID=UPI002C1E0752|nr:TaqI-like C-terminal specificity domain-containing protein [Methanothrix soehngenii]HOS22981.1 TaqI-like C-terminal specificity domain-containing protein [Methanothrix soehngenii]HPL19349.1 TaqI-like C-terminal specificity domain-containing protein [Methanothrix soehngenii]